MHPLPGGPDAGRQSWLPEYTSELGMVTRRAEDDRQAVSNADDSSVSVVIMSLEQRATRRRVHEASIAQPCTSHPFAFRSWCLFPLTTSNAVRQSFLFYPKPTLTFFYFRFFIH
jgi:hypothetical protein